AVTSVLIWIFYVVIVQFVIMAFGFHETFHVPVLASVTVLVMTGISVSVPSSPGYVGTYHYLVMQGLAIYGVPGSDALSFALVMHIFSMLPTTLLGLYYFTKQQLSLANALEEEHIAESGMP
ncbi:MAG TPA: flippase-like domain-containing protein, partial [Bacteroidetes bacterium]|nr:flippase-like domain-containing protein [Bacteroidota bacterium]